MLINKNSSFLIVLFLIISVLSSVSAAEATETHKFHTFFNLVNQPKLPVNIWNIDNDFEIKQNHQLILKLAGVGSMYKSSVRVSMKKRCALMLN